MFNDKHENRLKQAEFEKIADEIYNYSEGNIGNAVNIWVSSIKKYHNGSFELSVPEIKDLSALSYFSEEANQILALLMTHKRLNTGKASQMLNIEESVIQDNFAFLHRSGVLKEVANGVFEINPFIIALIKKHLLKKELL